VGRALVPQLACWLAQSELRQLSWPSTHLSRLRARNALLGLSDEFAGHPVWRDRQVGWMVEVDGEAQACLRQSG
jgi:hypothetical protein